MAEVLEKEEEKEKPKSTIDIVSNIYREATDYDMGKVLTIAKSVISTLQAKPRLNEVVKNNIGSLVRCIRHAISLGLLIDNNNYCYLVSYGRELKLMIGYQGYIYKVKQNYSNAIFQACLVKENDEIDVYKEKNNDYVNHKYSSPFGTKNKKIIGCYCIITIGEKSIIECLDRKQIDNIRAIAKTKNIWDKWEGEMCKKSVIRRACKNHFSAEVKDLNEYDNKMYDITPKPKKLPKTAGLEEANANANE